MTTVNSILCDQTICGGMLWTTVLKRILRISVINKCNRAKQSLSFIKPAKDQSKNNNAYLGGIRAIGMQLKHTQES